MKIFYTLAFILAVFTTANAKVIIVTCQNTPAHFLPVTINPMVGDTIRWNWVVGNHVVGPIKAADIPAGAAMFNAPINSSAKTFQYVLKVAGSYHYVCHPATPHNEDGFMVVSSTTGIPQNSCSNYFSFAYPNPFSEKLTIETIDANAVLIYNVIGEQIKSFTLNPVQSKFEADLACLPKGIFFYSILKDGILLETRKIVKE